jgi:hypothetical protein
MYVCMHMARGRTHIDDHVPVAELGVEVDDDLLLGVREEPALEVRAEVVGPAQAAALAAAQQAGELGHRAPAAMAVGEDEVDELAVLLRRPRPPLHPQLVAARLPTHPGRGSESFPPPPPTIRRSSTRTTARDGSSEQQQRQSSRPCSNGSRARDAGYGLPASHGCGYQVSGGTWQAADRRRAKLNQASPRKRAAAGWSDKRLATAAWSEPACVRACRGRFYTVSSEPFPFIPRDGDGAHSGPQGKEGAGGQTGAMKG